MKPFLIQQLERYALRLTELDFLLSREDIMADMTQFLKLSREHAEVSAVASRFARFQQRNADLVAAQAMLDEEDMREMAEEEAASASAELESLEAELQSMLRSEVLVHVKRMSDRLAESSAEIQRDKKPPSGLAAPLAR